MRNGNIELVRYPDSTLNLMNAFELIEQEKWRSLQDSSGTDLDFFGPDIFI